MWFWSSCSGMDDNASLFVEYFGWIGLYVWTEALEQGAVKCLNTLMEGMVDYRRLGDLHFKIICWNWNYCRFYLAITKSF